MILIGMFDSPFVRRVAVSIKLLGLDFEHRNWSIGKDFELIRQFNPLGRVPTLVLADGDSVVDSSAILDYLDDTVGPDRALLPRTGPARREALRVIALASGAAEKGVSQVYESAFRPEEKRHGPWVERCAAQMHGALAEIDRLSRSRPGAWLGDRMTQADVTSACVFTFLCEALALPRPAANYPGLAALTERCEALPAFHASRGKFEAPSRSTAA